MQKIDRVDFAQLLRELDAAGLSPFAVARRLGIPVSTPYRWLDGSEPLHSHGAALLLLHAEVVGIRHGEASAAQHPARTGSTTQGDEDDDTDRSDSTAGPRRRCAAG